MTGETDGAGKEVPADHYFYSPNRNYAALVLAPQAGQTKAGTLRLTPLGVTAKEADDTGDADVEQPWAKQVIDSDWFTTEALSTAGNRTGFRYGTLRFTGGAGDPINDDPAITEFHGAGYLLPCTVTTSEQTEWGKMEWDANIAPHNPIQKATRTLTETATDIPVHAIYDAGICYLSKYAKVELLPAQSGTRTWTEEIYRQLEGNIDNPTPGETHILSSTEPEGTFSEVGVVNTLTMVAGMSLTRGMVDEVARWQLTGPVDLRGTATLDDHVLGHDGLPEEDGQDSKDVWVPLFAAGSTWKFYDDTRVEGGTGNANGELTGLFARGVQTPGRLYLDFTVGVGTGDAPGTADDEPKPNTGNFSEQAWYRYGYEANQTTSTLSGMKPERAKPEDFYQAVAFQIRLSKKTGNVTLTLDDLPTARVQTFYVEEEAGATKALTLKLTRAEGVAALPIWDTVVAAARLDVSNNNTGVATATSGKGNALSLRPEGDDSPRRTPVHRGNATHGHGAFIVGATGELRAAPGGHPRGRAHLHRGAGLPPPRHRRHHARRPGQGGVHLPGGRERRRPHRRRPGLRGLDPPPERQALPGAGCRTGRGRHLRLPRRGRLLQRRRSERGRRPGRRAPPHR